MQELWSLDYWKACLDVAISDYSMSCHTHGMQEDDVWLAVYCILYVIGCAELKLELKLSVDLAAMVSCRTRRPAFSFRLPIYTRECNGVAAECLI